MDVHDPGNPSHAYYGLYTGVVMDRDDPEKLGRVRVQIPGLVEEGTGWALPLSFGGGMKERGSVFVPPQGADVGVFFRHGDIDQPYYVGGNLGRGEQLTGTEGDPDVRAIETETYVIVIDERLASRGLTLMDKRSGNVIQMNGVLGAITIEATTQVAIKSKGFVRIDGLGVFINGVAAGFGKV